MQSPWVYQPTIVGSDAELIHVEPNNDAWRTLAPKAEADALDSTPASRYNNGKSQGEVMYDERVIHGFPEWIRVTH